MHLTDLARNTVRGSIPGMWALIAGVGAVPKSSVWDRESAIGGTGRVSEVAAVFAGTLGTRIVLTPSRNPEFKGMTERNDGDLETSFLPGRELASATRLGRDYSVRVAGNDYSTHPSAIGMGGASRSPRAWAR